MIIKSSNFGGHNTRTVQVQAVTPGRHSSAGLKLISPEAAMRNLFMATLEFYAMHRQVPMPATIVKALRVMATTARTGGDIEQTLSDAIKTISESSIHTPNVAEALAQAKLALAVHTARGGGKQ